MEDNRKILVEELTKRLRHMTFDLPDEEFDTEEVNLIVSLLQIYDPSEEKFDVEESLKRFWDYVAFREKEDKLIASIREKEKKEKAQ